MTSLLIDTSVLVKWFHHKGEPEVEQARALRAAHVRSDVDVGILDLAYYEVGNVLTRRLRWPAVRVADQLDDLRSILGGSVAPSRGWLRGAAILAEEHALSFYDASWAAAALATGSTLVSADRRLLEAGLAESATEVAHRLQLDGT